MARTYQPGLVWLGKRIIWYVTKHRERITRDMSPQVVALLDALVSAAQALIDAIELPTGD